MATRKPDPIDIEVGQRIRIQRLASGMSQTDLGEQIGVTFQQVQKYEKGANRVGAERLTKIANVLEVPVESFFNGRDTIGTSSTLAIFVRRPAPTRFAPFSYFCTC